jgi:glycosyltransferase involved in cell wall biosynthesis
VAEHYTELGHECTVLTRSVSDQKDAFSYKVSRNPSFKQKLGLIKSHDVVHCNGASVELVFWAKLLGKPIIWSHVGYQTISIDGLGWHEGEASPLSAFPSFLFHVKKQGFLRGFIGYLKLLLRQFASLFVSKHVAITHWVAKRQALANQVVIYNPFPIDRFSAIAESATFEYDFFFLGRLVSEKGVSTLLKAFAGFVESNPSYSKKLLLIGDGAWRLKLEQLATELGTFDKVEFAGKQIGNNLLEYVSKGKIAIIPSEWEEPMGGVALEMLAAAKPVIVSQNGGLAECVGEAGLLFPNGNHKALQIQMERLYNDETLQNELKTKAKEQILKFDELKLTKEYIQLFETLV